MNIESTELFALWEGVRDSLTAATHVAYRNRHSMRWVRLDRDTHDQLAEACQVWRETHDQSLLPGHQSPVPPRAPDGSAPELATLLGYEVIIDDAVSGIVWDVGVPSAWDASDRAGLHFGRG